LSIIRNVINPLDLSFSDFLAALRPCVFALKKVFSLVPRLELGNEGWLGLELGNEWKAGDGERG
jgi:hypothetical protein